MARHMSRRHRRLRSRPSISTMTLGAAGVFFLLGLLVALKAVMG
jgi:hypothetical protein